MGADVGARAACASVDVGDDRPFRQDEAAVRLEQAEMVVRELIAGIAPVDLGAAHRLVAEAVLEARGERALEQAAARRSGIDRAGGVEEPLVDRLAALAP